MAGEGKQTSGDAWGDDISDERKAGLEQRLQAWEQEVGHGVRRGPFDGVELTGADVFWLAARTLAGANDVEAVAQQLERLRRSRHDWELQRTLSFDGLHLEGSRLAGAHLERAVLNEAHLDGASLREAHLDDAFLYIAHLDGASLVDAHLHAITLAEATLQYATLAGADLSGARLGKTDLSDTDLRRANLRDAGFWRTILRGAVLAEANLHRANILDADLRSADLRGARLDLGAKVDRFFMGVTGSRGTASFIAELYIGAVLLGLIAAIAAVIVGIREGWFRVHMLANTLGVVMVFVVDVTLVLVFLLAVMMVLRFISGRRNRDRARDV